MNAQECVDGLRYMWHGAISKDRHTLEEAAKFLQLMVFLGDMKDYVLASVVGDGVQVRSREIGPLTIAPGDGVTLTVKGVTFSVHVKERT